MNADPVTLQIFLNRKERKKSAKTRMLGLKGCPVDWRYNDRRSKGPSLGRQKGAISESKLSSMSDFTPVDVPGARRFCPSFPTKGVGEARTPPLLNREDR